MATCSLLSTKTLEVNYSIVCIYILLFPYTSCAMYYMSHIVILCICLAFCSADDVASDFTLRGVIVQSIHGDRLV